MKDQAQIYAFARLVPNELFYMLPYAMTLLALILVGGRNRAPAALGVPHDSGGK